MTKAGAFAFRAATAASGASAGSWITPTANGQCLMSGAAKGTPWVYKPATPLEKQIFWGIELSLN